VILGWCAEAEQRRGSRIREALALDNEFEYLCEVKRAQRELQTQVTKYFPGMKIILDPLTTNENMRYGNEIRYRGKSLRTDEFECGFRYKVSTHIGEDDRRIVELRIFPKDSIVEIFAIRDGNCMIKESRQEDYEYAAKAYRTRFNVLMMKASLRMAIREEQKRLGVIE
jgi:hypothetical protein